LLPFLATATETPLLLSPAAAAAAGGAPQSRLWVDVWDEVQQEPLFEADGTTPVREGLKTLTLKPSTQ
jgi:hypothetical protein